MTNNKVAFIGTHGTGKTTALYGMARGLQLVGLSTGLLAEVARLPEFTINLESTPRHQRNIYFSQVLLEEKLLLSGNRVIICDRATLDNYAYYLASVERSGLPDPYPWLREAVREHASSYKHFILVEPNLELVADGVRSTDSDFQILIHKVVLSLIQDFKLENVTKLTSSQLRQENELEKLIHMVSRLIT